MHVLSTIFAWSRGKDIRYVVTPRRIVCLDLKTSTAIEIVIKPNIHLNFEHNLKVEKFLYANAGITGVRLRGCIIYIQILFFTAKTLFTRDKLFFNGRNSYCQNVTNCFLTLIVKTKY